MSNPGSYLVDHLNITSLCQNFDLDLLVLHFAVWGSVSKSHHTFTTLLQNENPEIL